MGITTREEADIKRKGGHEDADRIRRQRQQQAEQTRRAGSMGKRDELDFEVLPSIQNPAHDEITTTDPEELKRHQEEQEDTIKFELWRLDRFIKERLEYGEPLGEGFPYKDKFRGLDWGMGGCNKRVLGYISRTVSYLHSPLNEPKNPSHWDRMRRTRHYTREVTKKEVESVEALEELRDALAKRREVNATLGQSDKDYEVHLEFFTSDKFTPVDMGPTPAGTLKSPDGYWVISLARVHPV